MNPDAPSIPEPERTVFSLPGGATIAFRLIPAGLFRMGSRGENSDEEPRHEVRIEHAFWLGETPVTQAQFKEWTQAEGVDHQNHFHEPPRPDHPAENMDWRQSNRFCAWMTEVIPKVPGNPLPARYDLFCLPTEAEWEYACRAGTETDYHTGDGEAALAEAAWFGEEWGSGSTHPVGKKCHNAYHLHDVHGNVWEWCHDVHDDAAYRQRVDGEPDPGWNLRRADWQRGLDHIINAEDDRLRVIRGGSWSGTARGCRSASRFGGWPVDRFRDLGFRVCLVPGPASQPEAPRAPGVGGRGTRPETDGAGGAGASENPDLANLHFSGAAGREFLPGPPRP